MSVSIRLFLLYIKFVYGIICSCAIYQLILYPLVSSCNALKMARLEVSFNVFASSRRAFFFFFLFDLMFSHKIKISEKVAGVGQKYWRTPRIRIGTRWDTQQENIFKLLSRFMYLKVNKQTSFVVREARPKPCHWKVNTMLCLFLICGSTIYVWPD